MIEALISSKTRVKLLLKFFLNSKNTSYLRGLASEFDESSNAIRVELNRFEKAGMLRSFSEGNRKYFQANTSHPLFSEVHNIILKHVGLDKIIITVIERLGALKQAHVIGDYAEGKNGLVIDLVLFGDINKEYLNQLIEKAEKLINRKIRTLIYKVSEKKKMELFLENENSLMLWEKEK